MTSGQCLCGAVRFRVDGAPRDVIVCHCSICRRLHGGPATYSAAPLTDFHLEGEDDVAAYEVGGAVYSFCARCGSRLSWRRAGNDYVAFNAALLPEPTGLETVRHIFVGSAGDYEDLSTDLPKHAAYSGSETIA